MQNYIFLYLLIVRRLTFWNAIELFIVEKLKVYQKKIKYVLFTFPHPWYEADGLDNLSVIWSDSLMYGRQHTLLVSPLLTQENKKQIIWTLSAFNVGAFILLKQFKETANWSLQ